MNKNISIGFLIIALLLGGYAALKPSQVIVQKSDGQVTVGAMSDGNVYLPLNAAVGFTSGGYIASSSGLSALTMAANELNGVSSYFFTPTVQAITLTLPASSTLSNFVPRPGDTKSIRFFNSTSTAAITLTFAGNTGTILRGVHGTSTLLTRGLNGVMTFTRTATTTGQGDIYVMFSPQ